jgi:hypothetical protein
MTNGTKGLPRVRIASQRLSAKVEEGVLRVLFANGVSKTWPLPNRENKAAIREIREAAMQFAKDHGATEGQQNAVRKALTNAGYHLTR